MRGHGEKLSRRKEAAIAALIMEGSIEKAAARAGIGAETLRRWLKLPEFSEAYAAARRLTLDGAVARLHSLLAEATETLKRNLKTDSPSVEVRAALGIYDLVLRTREALDIEERLARLEAAAEAQAARSGATDLPLYMPQTYGSAVVAKTTEGVRCET